MAVKNIKNWLYLQKKKREIGKECSKKWKNIFVIVNIVIFDSLQWKNRKVSRVRYNWISIYLLSNAIKNSDIIESRGSWNLILLIFSRNKNNRGV